MKAIIAIAVLLASSYLISQYVMTGPANEDDLRSLFNSWKIEHGKTYPDAATEEHRFEIFVATHNFIETHNSENHPTQVGHNQFSDLTSEEFGAMYTSGLMLPEEGSDNHQTWSEWEAENEIVGGVPTTWDWTTQANKVTPVRNQGQCGSCWAFAGNAVSESLLAIKGQGLNVLSCQQLVDCDTKSFGCNGGYQFDAWSIAYSTGVNTEAQYPYKAVKGTCVFKSATAIKNTKFGLKSPGYGYTTPLTFAAMQANIYKQPISVNVQANQPVFQQYKSGVLGVNCTTVMNHAVVAVGYNNAAQTIKIKNSWGTGWGMSGYAQVYANSSLNAGRGGCGILTWAFWPTW